MITKLYTRGNLL